jgi:hypothetical protein
MKILACCDRHAVGGQHLTGNVLLDEKTGLRLVSSPGGVPQGFVILPVSILCCIAQQFRQTGSKHSVTNTLSDTAWLQL